MDPRQLPTRSRHFLWIAGTTLALWSCTAGDQQRALPSSADRQARTDARACDQGDIIACHNLAVSWLHGAAGLTADTGHASRLFHRNCLDGSSESCRQAARIALPHDPHAARTLLQRACDSPDPFACHELGQHLLSGLDGEPEPLEALALFEHACSQRAARACVSVAQLLLDPDHPAHDEARGRPLLGRMCQEGQMSACADAGILLTEDLRRMASQQEAAETAREPVDHPNDEDEPGHAALPSAELHGERHVNQGLHGSREASAADNTDDVQPPPPTGNAGSPAPHPRDRQLPAQLTLEPAAASPAVVEELLRRGCLGGVGRSCSALADLLREGDLLPVDHERADRLDRMASEATR